GQLADAERQFTAALAQARAEPDSQSLVALIANRLASTYTLLGDGKKVVAFGQQALGAGTLDPATASRTRTRIAIGVSQVSGPRRAGSRGGRPGPGECDRRRWPVVPGDAPAAGRRAETGHRRPRCQSGPGA